jgi:hypothetical protein
VLIWLGAKAWNAWAMDRKLMKLQLPTDSDVRGDEHFPGVVSKRLWRKRLTA